MANMGKTNKRQVAMRLDLTLCRAVEKKFKKPEDDSDVVAYIRALEEVTRKVILTKEDYQIIQEQIEKNEVARAAKRKTGRRNTKKGIN